MRIRAQLDAPAPLLRRPLPLGRTLLRLRPASCERLFHRRVRRRERDTGAQYLVPKRFGIARQLDRPVRDTKPNGPRKRMYV